MPELLTPGVFIQEVEFGPQPIEGVSTSTAGFVGETERGPENQPTLVTSFADYSRKFGGFFGKTKYLPLAVRGFFENGGRRAFVVRVTGAGASASAAEVPFGYEVALLSGPQASEAGGNRRVFKVSTVVGLQVGETVEFFSRADATDRLTVTVRKIGAVTNTVDVEAASPADLLALGKVKAATHAVRYTTAKGAVGTSVIVFEAKDKGAYGAGIQVLLTPTYLSTGGITALTSNGVVVNQIAPFKAGQVVEIEKTPGGQRAYATVVSVDVPSASVNLPALPGGFTAAVGDAIRVTGWRLQVLFDGQPVETISDIPDGAEQLADTINADSQWVRVVKSAGSPSTAIGAVTGAGPVSFPFFSGGQPVNLGGGSNGTVDPLSFIGSEAGGKRTGLKALEAQDGISLIAVPGQTDVAVVNELIGQAERLMDRFAVFESTNDADIQNVMKERGGYNSKFAAMYHPWVKVLDPFSSEVIDVPPSGHILGSYARTDNDRGVFKAPANVTLRGITGLSRIVVSGEQDLLNPAGVNVLRAFDGLGNVIWGTRTVSAEGSWKYVPVRRLFIFIEQSIIRGTRFAVFEPNDQRLWAKLRDGVSNFLTTQWRAGALFGAKPEQAFFVRVDETTTTQDDRDNGRVNIIVGIAPVKPAEFVVFQIGQAPQSVIVAEQG